MPWPTSRLTTYAPGSQVKSADLNAMQDEAIAKNDSGVFTPILVNNGVDHATYTIQEGLFHRLGEFVLFQIRLIATSLDPAGTLRIKPESLPYRPADTAGLPQQQAAAVSRFSGGSASAVQVAAMIDQFGITLQQDVSSASATSWAALTSGTYVIVIGGCFVRET